MLTEEERAWLRDRGCLHEEGGFACVHGDFILPGKKKPKKIGRMSDPDVPGPVILDHEAWNSLIEGGKHGC